MEIVAAISHSRFWKDTRIFGIEDDPQAGWDHVSGYRTTAYVDSPFTKRRAVVSANYNNIRLLYGWAGPKAHSPPSCSYSY